MIYERLSEALRLGQPIALVTVIEGPHRGSKLLVEEGGSSLGSLGDPDLDRVVVRDATGELAAGITSVRHYGEHGQARERRGVRVRRGLRATASDGDLGAVDFTAALAASRRCSATTSLCATPREVFAHAQAVPDGR